MTDKTDKLAQIKTLINKLAGDMSDDDKKAIADTVRAHAKKAVLTSDANVVAISVDKDAEPNIQMIAVIMRVVTDMLDKLPNAQTGDAINALLNSTCNLFLTHVMPGHEDAGRNSIVKELTDGLDSVVARSKEVYKANPNLIPKFNKLRATIMDEKLDDKTRKDAGAELLDLRDRHNKLLRKAAEQGMETFGCTGAKLTEPDDEVDLDFDERATHRIVGNA